VVTAVLIFVVSALCYGVLAGAVGTDAGAGRSGGRSGAGRGGHGAGAELVRSLRMGLVVGDDELVVRNVGTTRRIPLAEVDHLEVVRSPWIAAVVRKDGRRVRVSALSPPSPAFRARNTEAQRVVTEIDGVLAERRG
jgi:hypothetical protein